jgi:hypothetical protein
MPANKNKIAPKGQGMKEKLVSFMSMPWYPIVSSAYPVLTLLSTNAGQVQPDAALRPLAASLLFGTSLFLLVWLFFRNPYRAAFLTTLLLAMFFAYGHAYIYIDEQYPESSYTGWLAVVWGLLFGLAFFWVTRPRLKFVSSTVALNTGALALVIMSAGQVNFEDGTQGGHRLAFETAPVDSGLVRPQDPPDVYFFLLDSYARADLLDRAYGFDNSEFIDELEKRDFFVPKCSQSNYVRTELSLGSSLNMEYLQNLSDTFTPENTRRRLLWDGLRHSAVRYNFETLGYETVGFATGFSWLDMHDADHFMSPPPLSSGMTEFEGLFLRTTLARHAQDLGWVDPDYMMGVSFRDRFNYVFDNIDEIAAMPQSTFSYIHLISPHPPFVFDPQGNPTYPPDFWNDQRMYPADLYQEGYLNQLQFLNDRMLEAIDTILSTSTTPPVIILQGDHGPWLQPKDKRFWNLTAIYFPGHRNVLYSTISPVNIFRLLFNSYFGTKYDILEDKSYFSPVPKLYEFSEMPYPCEFPNN